MPGLPMVQPVLFPVNLVALPAGSYKASGAQVFDSTYLSHAALDITLTSFTGGSTPSVTFGLDRQGNDGLWYPVWDSGAANSATVWSIDVSQSITQQTTGNPNAPTAAIHVVWTFLSRFRWTFSGNPTSVQFSASLIGR